MAGSDQSPTRQTKKRGPLAALLICDPGGGSGRGGGLRLTLVAGCLGFVAADFRELILDRLFRSRLHHSRAPDGRCSGY